MADRDPPNIIRIECLGDCILRIWWRSGEQCDLDLTQLIATGSALTTLTDPAVFASAVIGEYGWTVRWDDIELDADHLYRLAYPVHDPAIVSAIEITNRARAHKIKRRGFTGVITFENPGQRRTELLRFHKRPAPEHLIIVAEDLDEPDGRTRVPTLTDVEKIIAFGRRHAAGKVLSHCNAGVSRSTAAALVILADRLGPGREAESLAEMLRLRPCAVPNLLIVQLADQLLGRSGLLIKTVLDWDGRSAWCR